MKSEEKTTPAVFIVNEVLEAVKAFTENMDRLRVLGKQPEKLRVENLRVFFVRYLITRWQIEDERIY